MLHDKTLETYTMLCRQLNSFWKTNIDERQLICDIDAAIRKTVSSYDASNTAYYLKSGFNPLNTTVYAVFLYHLAHIVGIRGGYRQCNVS